MLWRLYIVQNSQLASTCPVCEKVKSTVSPLEQSVLKMDLSLMQGVFSNYRVTEFFHTFIKVLIFIF